MKRRSFLALGAAAPAFLKAQRRPPNVVMIYCDDLGYGDLGCYGGSLRTPNIDSLSRDGIRFTHFYSANPVCSPSRAALMTGRYPTRVGVPRVLFPNDSTGLADGEQTLAQLLKPAGYRTMCVGKWHLGHHPRHLPTSKGFDAYFGIPYSNDMNPPALMRNTDIVEQRATQETLTQRYTEEAVKFIAGSKEAPFFLYMPHTFPHIPLHASSKFRGKSPQGIYGDVMEELDWSVGEVLGALKKAGAAGNTLVMFSSDNGPWYQGSAGRLRGRKGSTWEGGVRVPFLARLPGRIPAGRVCAGIGSTMDVVPTVTRLAAAAMPQAPVDGIDILPMLTGKSAEIEREALLYFDNWDLQGARWKGWKLHVARHNSFIYGPVPSSGRKNVRLAKPELYNVLADVDESYDVADENPAVVKEIQARIERLLPGFPEPVSTAWSNSAEGATTPAGAIARPKA